MRSKKGALGEGVLMVTRVLLVAFIAFVIFGIASVFYVHYIDVRDAEAVIMKRLMSMRRAQELGFAPRVKLKDGIEKTIDWYINL